MLVFILLVFSKHYYNEEQNFEDMGSIRLYRKHVIETKKIVPVSYYLRIQT